MQVLKVPGSEEVVNWLGCFPKVSQEESPSATGSHQDWAGCHWPSHPTLGLEMCICLCMKITYSLILLTGPAFSEDQVSAFCTAQKTGKKWPLARNPHWKKWISFVLQRKNQINALGSWTEQHQHHQDCCEKCKFPAPTPGLVNQKLRGGAQPKGL